MLGAHLTGIFFAAHLGQAQQTSTDRVGATATASESYATSTATSQYEACGQISAYVDSYISANPSATAYPTLPYNLTRECRDSVPLDQDDATKLVDGLMTLLEFQSDLAFKTNPPSSYLLAPCDIMGSLQKLKNSVTSGGITSEIEFERQIQLIYGQAHDGHLTFNPDGLRILAYKRPFGPLVSVSMDGVEEPKIYFYREMLAWLQELGPEPSAITQINGMEASAFIFQEQANGTYGGYQDPDALYNAYFFAFNNGVAGSQNWGGLFAGYSLGETGPSTSLQFENGSFVEKPNVGDLNANFSSVVDGNSFYQKFVNTTVKDEVASASRASASASVSGSPTATAGSSAHSAVHQAGVAAATGASSQNITQLSGYPLPIVISEDGTASGYFLDYPGYEDVAVLSLRAMSEDYYESFQETVAEFLSACRSANKTRLVLDFTGNPGGNINTGYDVFKQLFPTLNPYGAGNFRAHEAFELLGEVITQGVKEQLLDNPENYTTLATSGLAATTWENATGQLYQSFDEFYGPVSAPNGYGNFTDLSRLDISSAAYDLASGGFVISGEANSTNHAPQPFASENIIILSDGRCGSTCTTMTHFLKWQGKVKSIALGGRPENKGPMQTMGGIKGNQLYTYQNLYDIIYEAVNSISSAESTWANTTVLDLFNNFHYLKLRTSTQQAHDISFNYRNGIAENDTSLTPLQFVYEAADCRMYYTPGHIMNITLLWIDVAANAFGINGTSVFEKCTPGSTNHPSSLSGNPELYNGGQITNVTGIGPLSTSSTNQTQTQAPSQQGAQPNTASTQAMSLWVAVLALVVAAVL